jgi:hypothetical protein
MLINLINKMEFSGNKSTVPSCITINQIWLKARDRHFLNLARSSGVKKSSPIATESSGLTAKNTASSPNRSKPTEQLVSVPLRTHTRLEPPSQFFAVVPDVDTESMLCHASETLASLSVMATDLARELEGPRRHVILAIQQMSALGELLVNRALDTLEPPRGSAEVSCKCQR